ncbi:MAG: hypothetical protein V1701_11035 [Planctomycetota bacterium]
MRAILPKLYRVEEITHHLSKQGIRMSRQTVHNYTMMGLISEVERTPAGHRLYGEDVIERLMKVTRLKMHRSLLEVKKFLGREDK